MITKATKSRAVGMLKAGASINEVAGELDLPLNLVNEWKNEADVDVFDSIEATNHAVSRILKSDAANDENVLDRVQGRLEGVVEQLVDEIEMCLMSGDVGKAQVIKACSESTVKLYTAFVLTRNIGQSGVIDQLSNTSVSSFQALLKD